MELTTFATYVGLVRDFLLLALMLGIVVAVLVIYKKISSTVESARQTMKTIEEVTSTFSTGVAKPVGVASGIGKVGSFFWRLVRRRRKGRGDEDEQQ